MKQHQILLTVNDDLFETALDDLRSKNWVEELSYKGLQEEE
jgi:hypothetical protein